MFGKIVQKWNAFRADWKQYRELCRAVKFAQDKMEGLRRKITVLYDMDLRPTEKSCIRANLMRLPDLGNGTEKSFSAYEVFCPCFLDMELDVPCSDVTCKYISDNRAYAASIAEYMDAVERRRTFWKNTKSHTK